MIGYGIVMLARGLGRDPGEAFVLSAMNPLVLLTLIGGAHNDAIMAGFLVVGIALAVQATTGLGADLLSRAPPRSRRRRRSAWRSWPGPGSGRGRRSRTRQADRSSPAGRGGDARRVDRGSPGSVSAGCRTCSPTAPCAPGPRRRPASGMALTNTLHALGLPRCRRPVGAVGDATVFGLLDGGRPSRCGCSGTPRSAAGSARSRWRSCCSWSSGPVVQPWYLAWGLVLLAASYKGREHFWLLALSITGPFIGLPGGRQLLGGPRAQQSAADRAGRGDRSAGCWCCRWGAGPSGRGRRTELEPAA